jgi:dCMP deaminase
MRPTSDDYFLSMASLVSSRTTCLRRSVGCVLVNHRKHVIATGYNGVAAGRPHCNEVDPFDPAGYPNACSGAHSESGTELHLCEAIHAEQNALLQCRDVYEIHTAYVTVSPCIHCMKLLLNTSCQRIVCWDRYSQAAIDLWQSAGRELVLKRGI